MKVIIEIDETEKNLTDNQRANAICQVADQIRIGEQFGNISNIVAFETFTESVV
jgi:hypothetical protein